MSGANTFKFVMLPPQTEVTRGWGRALAETMPEVRVIIAEDQATAEREIVDAEAAFGRLPREVLAKARRLRWLQAPQIAPPAGYYYPELIEHSLTVTNFREIFNDHISAHIMAFVLAFARGLQVFIPQQLRREWKRGRDGAAGRSVWHYGAGDGCAAYFGAAWRGRVAQAGGARCAAAARGLRHPYGAAHAGH
jgi:phosphoglycerate dehydrogenase-like enzyme